MMEPAGSAAPAAEDDRPLLFALWHLLKVMRESADASYARITPLSSVDRQMLLILHRSGTQTFPALCTLIGKDKAQISRALGRLEAAGYVVRARARGALGLTAEGDGLARRVTAQAGVRNTRLLAGLDDATIADLHRVAELLILRANTLYEAERALGTDAAPGRSWFAGEGVDLPRPPGDALLLPRLIALLAYAQRSLALAAKRLVGMPAFDTLVLSFIVTGMPLAQAALVAMLSRDQSQAARTIRRLIKDGLILRTPQSTRRAILLAPTDEGLRINAIMATEVARREAFLGEAVDPDRLAAFRRTLVVLSANAAAMAAAPASSMAPAA